MNKCKCVCHNYDETVNNDDCCANPEPSSFLLGYKKPTRERKTMNNLQQEIIKDFRKKFIKGVAAMSLPNGEVQEAESWIEADQEELEEWLWKSFEAVRKQAYSEGLEYGMVSRADEYRRGYKDKLKEEKK